MNFKKFCGRLRATFGGRRTRQQTVAMGAYLNEIASDALFDLLKSQGYTAVALGSEAEAPDAGRPLTCVIVEDNAFDRMHLRRLLASMKSDMTIKEFETIAAARAYLVENPADIVLLDHMLPDGIGMDLAQELIRDTRLRGAGIAMITGAPIESSDPDVPVLQKSGLTTAAISSVVAKVRRAQHGIQIPASRMRSDTETIQLLDQVIERLEDGLGELEIGNQTNALSAFRNAAADGQALRSHLTKPDN